MTHTPTRPRLGGKTHLTADTATTLCGIEAGDGTLRGLTAEDSTCTKCRKIAGLSWISWSGSRRIVHDAASEEEVAMTSATYPAKVQRVVDTIERTGNTAVVDTSEITVLDKHHSTMWWITFKSIERHPMLRTTGWFKLYTRKGRTRFGGGELHDMSKTVKISTWSDLDIVLDVYTPTPGRTS